ncbi:MAG: hypothetical protein ACLFU9_06420 [Candidatus Bathyarchaeia archaeon]
MQRTQEIALISLFGALHTVLSFIPGIWRSWMILILPLEGIILGPARGFLAGFIGFAAGWTLRPRPEPVIFGLAEPIGVLCAAFIVKRKWHYAALAYVAMLAAFFLHPITPNLPLWTLWDIYAAFVCILIFGLLTRGQQLIHKTNKRLDNLVVVFLCVLAFALFIYELVNLRLYEAVGFSLLFVFGLFLVLRLKKRKRESHSWILAIAAFVGIEADVLTRIFIFVPLNFYEFMGVPSVFLPEIFVLGAFQTPIEAVFSVLATVIIGVPLIDHLKKLGLFDLETRA